ncbi:MAG: hypothetical protein Ta2A_06850 [Treponemataceae bacterium]|nr:MAG: hypothetical protein Ta2A_06850 [Treponemataceae bacterium]
MKRFAEIDPAIDAHIAVLSRDIRDYCAYSIALARGRFFLTRPMGIECRKTVLLHLKQVNTPRHQREYRAGNVQNKNRPALPHIVCIWRGGTYPTRDSNLSRAAVKSSTWAAWVYRLLVRSLVCPDIA